MSVPLPTFLLLGAPRAGTTALHQWLGQHPDVCMSRPKETQFFSLHHDQGLEAYRRCFAHYSGERAVGESTPMYLSLPHVPRRIARLLPGAALIAVLRDPVDQAYSSWWMMRCLGVEPRPFETAVAEELAAEPLTEEAAEPYWRRLLDAAGRGRPEPDARYLMTGDYAAALRRYLTHFPREQLTLLLHEDLVADPASATAAIARAAAVDPQRAASPVPPRVNSSTGRVEAVATRRVAGLPSARVRRALVRGARALDRGGPPPIAPGVRAEVAAYFAAANADLPVLAGLDLSRWSTGSAARRG